MVHTNNARKKERESVVKFHPYIDCYEIKKSQGQKIRNLDKLFPLITLVVDISCLSCFIA